MLQDDDERRSRPVAAKPLETLGIAELETYIAQLQGEIARAKAEIARKQSTRDAASAFFKL